MSRFREVLKKRNFFFLWTGQIISQLGDRLGQMALIALVYARTPGSAVEMAKVLSFTIIPVFLIGPIAGVYVDRWDRRITMYSCDFLRGALVLCIPLFFLQSYHLIPVYAMIFLIFSVGRFFVPAKLAIVPELVEQKDLLLANSLINTTGMIAAVLGFGISGVLVEWLGAKSGFYLDSLGFFISATCIFLISIKSRNTLKFSEVRHEIVDVIRQSMLRKSVLQEVKEGILYFTRKKDIRLATGIIFVLWSALGAVYTVLIVFVQQALHSATKDLGLLVMFLGIGLFAGSLAYGRFGQRISHYKTIFSSLVASGIMLVGFAFGINQYPYFFVAAALAFFLGLTVSPIMIASNTIVHNVSENQMMGKVFSSLEIVMHLGFLVFMFISSFLANHVPSLYILVFVGSALSVMGAFHLICQRKIA